MLLTFKTEKIFLSHSPLFEVMNYSHSVIVQFLFQDQPAGDPVKYTCQ